MSGSSADASPPAPTAGRRHLAVIGTNRWLVDGYRDNPEESTACWNRLLDGARPGPA